MRDFLYFMRNKGIEITWEEEKGDKILNYFPINAKKKSLKDFNRVQTY
jgi:hypothetical protein